MPHIAPKKYFDLYPIDKVSLPTNEYAPKDLPEVAWNGISEFRSYPDNAQAAKEAGFGPATPFNATWTRHQRQAYFAAASFMDAQLAKVIMAFNCLPLLELAHVLMCR